MNAYRGRWSADLHHGSIDMAKTSTMAAPSSTDTTATPTVAPTETPASKLVDMSLALSPLALPSQSSQTRILLLSFKLFHREAKPEMDVEVQRECFVNIGM